MIRNPLLLPIIELLAQSLKQVIGHAGDLKLSLIWCRAEASWRKMHFTRPPLVRVELKLDWHPKGGKWITPWSSESKITLVDTAGITAGMVVERVARLYAESAPLNLPGITGHDMAGKLKGSFQTVHFSPSAWINGVEEGGLLPVGFLWTVC